jgi:hypothetical protein
MSRRISFRGKIASGAQESIPLQSINGMIGYQIKKFQLMLPNPGTSAAESVVKIYKTEQDTIDSAVDFSDNRLLAAAFLAHDNAPQYSYVEIVVFDNEKFNQDVYVTHNNSHSGAIDCNYYIEMEQMKLDLNEQTVATLKDIRNSGSQ